MFIIMLYLNKGTNILVFYKKNLFICIVNNMIILHE